MATPTPAYICKDRLIGDGFLFNMGRVLKKNIEARRHAPSAPGDLNEVISSGSKA